MCLDKGGRLGNWERFRGTDMKATEMVDRADFGRRVCELSGEGRGSRNPSIRNLPMKQVKAFLRERARERKRYVKDETEVSSGSCEAGSVKGLLIKHVMERAGDFKIE